jgi:hypothetical protein
LHFNLIKLTNMEIKISTEQILKVLYILTWIIFVGLCIEAGLIICSPFFTMFKNADNANQFGLTKLYEYDKGFYLVQSLLMSIVAVLKAILFYVILKTLHNKKLDMKQPFSAYLKRFILSIAWLALGIGFFAIWGAKYAAWFTTKGIKMPDIANMHLGGADVWIFMGIILLVIAQIFKKGIEIQTENELTV